jgi:hypothetical protein
MPGRSAVLASVIRGVGTKVKAGGVGQLAPAPPAGALCLSAQGRRCAVCTEQMDGATCGPRYVKLFSAKNPSPLDLVTHVRSVLILPCG